jgi:hypothetical protein
MNIMELYKSSQGKMKEGGGWDPYNGLAFQKAFYLNGESIFSVKQRHVIFSPAP